MVKIPSPNEFSVTINLTHLSDPQRKEFSEELRRAARDCTHHQLPSELDGKHVLKIGPFPHHDIDFILGAICGLAHGMKIFLPIGEVDIHVESPSKK